MDNNAEVVYLYLDDIIPNRFQPREIFDEQGLKELAVSIKEHGVIQPIIVRKVDNKYEIIAGERRYKASTMAGLTKIPAIVKNLDDKESSKVALIENLQRKDLSPIEEARTYQKILDLEDGMTQQELAASVGKTQSSVSNKIRLLALPDEVQDALLNNKISERHARCLLNIENADEQVKMLSRITEEKLTVRELDKIIKDKDKPEEEPRVEEEPEEIIPDNDEEPQENEVQNDDGPSVPGISLPEVKEEPEEVITEEVVNEDGEIVTQEIGDNTTKVDAPSETPEEEPAEAIRDMTETENNNNTFDVSNIENPFARKEVEEPMDQSTVQNNTGSANGPVVPGLNLNINPAAVPQAPTQMQPQMVPQSQVGQPQQMPGPMQPQMMPQGQMTIPQQMPAPVQQPAQAPVSAGMNSPVVSAPAGGTDSKAITESINKLVEDYKKKGANIDFRSYNIGTVTSISITIR